MRIGVDARPLARKKSGVGYYVFNILEQLSAIDPVNEYYLYANQSLPDMQFGSRFHARIMSCGPNNWWLQYLLPRLLKQDKIDMFWGGGFTLPIFTRIKRVVTIHDFVFRRYAWTLPASQVIHLRLGMPVYLRSADHVIVDSQNTAKDLQELYSYPAEKTTIIHLAAHRRFFAKLPQEAVNKVLGRYGLSPGYVLMVGTIEPRKGFDTALKAIEILRTKYGQDIATVIVGSVGWKAEGILEQIAKGRRVHYLQYVSEADLPALYQGAKVFLYPSLYEGFGLPLLEAMASGIPVITSTAASLPEVAGDAVLYAAPGDERDVADKLKQILTNVELGKNLVKKGHHRASEFSWRETAEHILAVFNEIYTEEGGR